MERAGRTRLGACYQQVPVQVLPPFHFASETAALLYLINPTVGLMDGDAHRIDVTARRGTRAVVTGQSASRIHPALAGYATQQWSIRVDDGADLVVLPGPAIPYRGARFYQRVRIDLAATARLVWGDVWHPGRHLYGADPELFVFDRLVQHLEVRRAGRLVYRDRFDWRGPWTADDREWHLGGRLAAGTLFATGPVREGPAESDTFQRAVLPLASGDTCVRVCGDPRAVTWECARFAFAAAGDWSDGPPWLSGGNNFSTNHWFSAPPG
ncbi:urease accessory protein UreD [Fimbriiglobus ruber]|uniref:Urease accessory protein UreD n=1 Tax=Fimbriiglobus ruber TaxID=1908690 RepID=A0A225DVX9_9BACT|nr:urease accessory protein UreD [Fimbriiglobus ruber]OWK40357.1 Urease accessory protein UreD [Fimbriiglobus ruber]